MPLIHKLLVANRGEIAVRIMKTAKKMGIHTVAVYSEADKNELFVQCADEGYCLGGFAPSESYLDVEKILQAATVTGADAIHPGYGFLSENAAFAQQVIDSGRIWVGPHPTAISQMGSKTAARALAAQAGVPIVPGFQGTNVTDAVLIAEGLKIGFPLLIKASAGGGGRGMRIVQNESELKAALESARSEALAAFGDATVFLERYFESSKHIEIQILGDKHGSVVHLFERECSLQRRHQKIVEESPSVSIGEVTRHNMCTDALKLAKALQYDNAGTVEFLLDNKKNYYFLEVNTRLQVEHPVTEWVTGVDLVELQLKSAEGFPLPQELEDIQVMGWAIEARLCAEDPRTNFAPTWGNYFNWQPLVNEKEDFRCDHGLKPSGAISTYYDNMLAKVIAFAPTREQAIRKLVYALQKTNLLGVQTNKNYLTWLLAQEGFADGSFDTQFVANTLPQYNSLPIACEAELIAATLYRWWQRKQQSKVMNGVPSGWRNNRFATQYEELAFGDKTFKVKYICKKDAAQGQSPVFEVMLNDQSYSVTQFSLCGKSGQVNITINNHSQQFNICEADDKIYLQNSAGGYFEFAVQPRFPDISANVATDPYTAAVPGQVVRVHVQAGDAVKAGDALVVLSSMKMENTICAVADAVIKDIFVTEKTNIPAGTVLLAVE